MCQPQFESPYLTKQIIAYIGNKRKLLSLIYKALAASGLNLSQPLRFADLFSGSGVVARFAKSLGFEVYCNDWEAYSEALLQGFVALNKSDCDRIFEEAGQNLSDELTKINSLPPLAADSEDAYISRYYGAQQESLTAADFRRERLFYTRQNALAIDSIRSYIEKNYPQSEDKRRHILLALLLYEAATHTNTSGVFKAYHKGFGGHGKDALKRILEPIALHQPVLIDSRAPVHVFRKDANLLVRELPEMDVVYLDPPYNQHQYGSNYHLLNTILLWDKIPVPLSLDEEGVLKNKAGIRTDWKKTRSPYCYQKTALAAFKDLLDHIRAKIILISYSSDGIIPFEAMKELCLQKGFVSLITSGYTVYRGGKQSNRRKSEDIEFVLVIDTSRPADASCSQRIDRLLLERQLLQLLRHRYNMPALKKAFLQTFPQQGLQGQQEAPMLEGQQEALAAATQEAASLTQTLVADDRLSLTSSDGISLALAEHVELAACSSQSLQSVCQILRQTMCQTKQEELSLLVQLASDAAAGARTDTAGKDAAAIAKKRELIRQQKALAKKALGEIPATLKKLAQKKYREAFYQGLDAVRALSTVNADLYAAIAKKVEAIASTAEIRFSS